MMIDAELWQAYSDPYLKFSAPFPEQDFAIITASNPHSVICSEQENGLKNSHLRRDVRRKVCVSVVVGNEDFSWSEESFAIVISKQQAIDLAQKYHQNAIYFVQGKRLFLLSCLADRTEINLGEWLFRLR
ncbi:DUF3293 domain-containing protein [Vibrio sp. LaRot3]|uniref:DUF3293 domain-containing protein n=1 Tax=Vibrio sp. LaRot3 TaxID=2998829 RepID=UPI0022CE10A3|nr:DUF3293 domain-containing protein [Vibrio sp. LaRot3]MDA0148696.1 DUF3293 domain-containing protein [Vibrio sp. LaRot3]